jgi:hypothetical protein
LNFPEQNSWVCHCPRNNQNLIYKELNSRVNSGNESYNSVKKSLSFHLLSTKQNIKICNFIILPAVFIGVKIRSLIRMEKYGLRLFKNKILKKISEPKREEVIWRSRKLLN